MSMADKSLERLPTTTPANNEQPEPGGFGVVEAQPEPVAAPVVQAPAAGASTLPPAVFKRSRRAATVEHLAARRNTSTLTMDQPEVKQKLGELRAEMTTLLTDFRWGGASVQTLVERIIPLLNLGSLQQWIPVLAPTLLEIDRAGNLVPVWLKLAEQEDPEDLPADANPADTEIGRARRIALLMLGYYKSPELSSALGKLATDPHSSLYATQALARQGTVAALQALVIALKEAKGWAKVDIMDAFATINQARFYDLMLASGLNDAEGLESYLAVPLYKTLPLEKYLNGGKDVAPNLTQQAALIFAQVLQDSNPATASTGTTPMIFERDLPRLAFALFEGTKSAPAWYKVVALHRLGLFMGRYWAEISRGAIQNPEILQPIYACLPLMPQIEQWMGGPGRNVLLQAVEGNDEAMGPSLRVLKELGEPGLADALLRRLETTFQLIDREQAVRLGQICDTLVQLRETRAVPAVEQLLRRVVPIDHRASRPRRTENLPTGDPDIPASILYGAALRTFAQFNDSSTLSIVLRAAKDFDPFVRSQALEALKTMDPQGSDSRSRAAAREGLNDPRDAVVRVACQLVAQYHDRDARAELLKLRETRPELVASVEEALKQLDQ